MYVIRFQSTLFLALLLLIPTIVLPSSSSGSERERKRKSGSGSGSGNSPLLTENHAGRVLRMMAESLREEDGKSEKWESCGDWHEKYIELHKEILKRNPNSRKKRIIVFMCHPQYHSCGGLGDQLIGIMATFLIAILSNRAFIIHYPEFTNVFDPVAIDWRYHGDVYLGNYTYIPFNHLHHLPFRKINIKESAQGKHTIYVSMMQLGWKHLKQQFEAFFRLTKNYKNVIVRANHGIYSYFASGSTWITRKLKEKGFNETIKPGCLLRFLLKPKSGIVESVREIEERLVSPNVFSVCIHVRPFKGRHVDDSVFFPRSSSEASINNVNFIFECAQTISDHFTLPNQKVIWFLMSSSTLLKQKMYEKYPDLILKTDIQARHVDKIGRNQFMGALIDTVKEWYLFSKCNKYVLISSGLSKTAIAYSLNSDSTFMFPHTFFARFNNPSNSNETTIWKEFCDPTRPTSLMDMANEWSHL